MTARKTEKTYNDDDGRTIADMSEVRRRNLIFPSRIDDEPFFGSLFRSEKDKGDDAADEDGVIKNANAADEDGIIMDPEEAESPGKAERPWKVNELTRGEKRAQIWGSLSAGLLVLLIFLVFFGIVIGLMVLLW